MRDYFTDLNLNYYLPNTIHENIPIQIPLVDYIFDKHELLMSENVEQIRGYIADVYSFAERCVAIAKLKEALL